MQDLEQARARRFADDDLRDVVGTRVRNNVVGNAARAAWHRDRFTAEVHRKPQGVGDAVALLVAELRAAAGFDVYRRPWRMNAVGEAPGGAHQAGSARIFADTDQNPLSRRPRSLDGLRLHLGEQLLVHPLGGAAQRKLAQRNQIGGREEVHQRAFRL